MAYIPIAFQDFSGGWNPDTAPDLLRDNEYELGDNVESYIVGAVKQRGGVIPLNAVAYDEPISLLLEWNRKNGTTQYIGMKGNDLCYFDQDNDWEASEPIKKLDSPDIGYFFFNDAFYFTGKQNGVNKYWKLSSIYQKERLTISGTATAGGKVFVTLTSALLNAPVTVIAPISNNDTMNAATAAIYEAMKVENAITDIFLVEYTAGERVLYVQSIQGVSTVGEMDTTLEFTMTLEEGATGLTFVSADVTAEVGVKEKGLLTMSGTCTVSGNVVATVTSNLFATPKVITAAVVNTDTSTIVATKLEAALKADAGIVANFTVTRSGRVIYLLNILALDNDDTFHTAITLTGGCVGPSGAWKINPHGVAAGGAVEVEPKDDDANDLNPIRKCRCFTWNPKNSRVFASGNPDDVSCLYYSEANDPTFFKATNKVYPTQGEGKINGISNFSTGLVVEFTNDLWAWTGYDPGTDATWSRVPITHGSLSHGSVCQTPNSLTMVGIGGLYALSPGVMDKDLMLINAAQMSVNLAQNRVVSVLKNAIHIDTMKSVFQKTKSKYLLAYGDDPLNSKNNKILVYDFARNNFGRFTGIQADAFCDCANGDVLIASGNWILKMDEGLNDWDIVEGEPKAIPLRFKSKGWDFGLPFISKKLKKLFLASHQYENTGTTIDLGLRGGYKSLVFPSVNSIVYEDAELPDAFVWGDNWGALWGWSDINQKEFRVEMKATRIQIDITHEVLDEDLLIYGFAFLYKPTKAKGVKYDGVASKDILS